MQGLDLVETGEDEPEAPLQERRKRRFLRELPFLAVAALVIALLIKSFLVQLFYIPSESMEPTLLRDDRVLVSRLAYRLGEPHRGDVVVFRNPSLAAEPRRGVLGGFAHWVTDGPGIGRPENEDYIKRVIGEPGDIVAVAKDGVSVNGELLDEPYIARNGGPTGEWTVPEDHVFVMGDNRDHSEDSRVFEAIPIDSIVGKAVAKVWPLSRWDGL
ncbi:MAG: signal peptidase I [Actinomycetota bacterium]